MNLRNRLLNNPCILMMIGMTCFVIGDPAELHPRRDEVEPVTPSTSRAA